MLYSAILTIGRRSERFHDWSVLCASGFLVTVMLMALLVPILSPYGVFEQDFEIRLAAPGFAANGAFHLLGTDELGRDLLTRTAYAVRISVFTAIIGSLIGSSLGTVLGILAAHYRGFFGGIIVVLMDFQAALPFLILAIAVLAFLGNSLPVFIVLLGLYGWETYARLARGLVSAASEQRYVEALYTLGFSERRIYVRHVLPNIASALIVQLTINFPNIIIAESGLSFLGVGIQPPMTSLGLMIGVGREYILSAWWLALVPGSMIFLTTLAVTILGDKWRDRLDASLK